MKNFLAIFVALICTGEIWAVPPNFDYDFSGFNHVGGLFVENCNNIRGQIIDAFGALQEPTHQADHVTCVEDETVGHRVRFTVHRDLDFDASDNNRCRLEIGTRHDRLRAREGDTFIYAWWFFLSSSLVPSNNFWLIFQIKSSGDGVNPNPTMAFGLRKREGLDLEFNHDNDQVGEKHTMLPLEEARGKWIQAYVKINYSRNGSADVYLKDQAGKQLFHKTLRGSFWWDNAAFYGPKWGLYRWRVPEFNPTDYAFFQNFQYWKK